MFCWSDIRTFRHSENEIIIIKKISSTEMTQLSTTLILKWDVDNMMRFMGENDVAISFQLGAEFI